MNDFHYVAVMLDMLYGIEMDDEDLEELGLIAWNLIGNKNIRLHRCRLKINEHDLSITLPCNATNKNGELGGVVELVTASYEDWQHVTNHTYNGDINSSITENQIEYEKYYQGPFYLPGKILKYHQVEDKLYFTHNYGTVNILYKGVIADDEGLPKLTDKEATAIATYIAYVTKFKEGLITNNQAIVQMAEMLNAKWLRQCDQARVTYLNQNDMNQIIEIKNSWDRGIYSKSYKGLK